MTKHNANSIFKFDDSTVYIGWVNKNDEMDYREEIRKLMVSEKNKLVFMSAKQKSWLLTRKRQVGGEHNPLELL